MFIFLNYKASNGPGVITRVLNKLCDTDEVLEMISMKTCKGFQILPIESCYAIEWRKHEEFFENEFLNKTLRLLENSIIAHVWNRLSYDKPLSVESDVAYIHLARKFCPKVFKASKFF
jgi:lactosylceramide 4-alpha-galactosyltransferase